MPLLGLGVLVRSELGIWVSSAFSFRGIGFESCEIPCEIEPSLNFKIQLVLYTCYLGA